MSNEDSLRDKLKESLSKLDEGFEVSNPLVNSIDLLVDYFTVLDEKITPLYEKFKVLSEIFDKVDLIEKTTIRMINFRSLHEKSKDDSFLNLFQ